MEELLQTHTLTRTNAQSENITRSKEAS